MSVLSDALSSAELQAARPERAPSPRASAWMRLQGWSGTTPPGAGEMGRPGSRGRPCLTPPECAHHVLSDQETLNKPMFEMCFSKYLLSQSFRTQVSNTGPRVEPTAGKGLSPPDTSSAHGKRGRTHTPGALSGGRLAPRGWGEGDPHGEAWEPDTRITWRGFPPSPGGHTGEVAPAPALPSSLLPAAPACWRQLPVSAPNPHPEIEYLLV